MPERAIFHIKAYFERSLLDRVQLATTASQQDGEGAPKDALDLFERMFGSLHFDPAWFHNQGLHTPFFDACLKVLQEVYCTKDVDGALLLF